MDVQFATCRELIDELMNRTNFIGVCICSPSENRNSARHPIDEFEIHGTVGEEDLYTILSAAISSLCDQRPN